MKPLNFSARFAPPEGLINGGKVATSNLLVLLGRVWGLMIDEFGQSLLEYFQQVMTL
jgi:hypothetical protein